MRCNVGGLERNLRLAGGAVALGLGIFGPLGRRGRVIALSLGGMELATGLTRYCPFNQALHINTCRKGPLQVAWDALKKVPGSVL